MNKELIFSVFSILIALCTSCDRKHPGNHEWLLKRAGSNSKEIEQLITWGESQPTVEKKAAAHFLLNAVANDYALEYRLVNDHGESQVLQQSLPVDSLEAVRGRPGFSLIIDTIPDIEVITTDFVIKHFNRSFYIWKHYKWNKKVSFQDFCQYILPYRMGNEQLSGWQEYYQTKYAAFIEDIPGVRRDTINSLVRYFETESCIKELTPSEPRFIDVLILPPFPHGIAGNNYFNDLGDQLSDELYKLRSIGIPASFEYSIYMPHRNGHEGVVVIKDSNGHFVNKNQWAYDNNLAKYYRRVFHNHDSIRNPFAEIKKMGIDEESIPLALNLPQSIDITNERTKVANIRVYLDPATINLFSVLYIGVFSEGDWKVVHWGKVKKDGKGYVEFEKMGSNGLYHLMSFQEGKAGLIGSPFKLDDNGRPFYYECMPGVKEDMQLSSADVNEPLLKGMVYEFSYWSDKKKGWVLCSKQKVAESRFSAKNVPQGTIYKMHKVGSAANERVFTYASWIGQWYW